MQLLRSESKSTFTTCAGFNAFAMYTDGSSFHSTISIFSPFNSFTIFCTRCPRGPTQVPTGSKFVSLERTATFARSPASRAIETISTTPS